MKLSAVSFATVSASVLAAATLIAQQFPSPTPTEIHVDSRCRIVTQPSPTATIPNPKLHYRYDHVVCHLESQLASSHIEPNTTTKGPKNIRVYISEREYVLQNTTSSAVTFVISQPLRKGWSIDSDPQPTDTTGNIATFRVIAQPHQIVRLHVGERS
ncbi:hypothetical protein GCM10011507_00590 [Edaphobacter acidisoli]|uniref:Uncharacterized protein n=1 Tax=Edaphobacter acidisoli TaxID=2040573 RepID=A0A916REQ4_9BACT|nr:hypothetical protein [Edaphobacter acidisoli]GGA53404.1 hypothetical protein GCM10011507_00590 [Edaphobacter acidisoli]